MSRYAVIWDRDGCILCNNRMETEQGKPGPYYVLCWGDVHWRQGAREALALLKNNGIDSYIVTKQRCIDKNLITYTKVLRIQRQIEDEIEKAGGKIKDSVIVYGSDRLKTEGGTVEMKEEEIRDLAGRHDFSLSTDSFGIGDSWTDIEAYNRAGLVSIKLETDIPDPSTIRSKPELLITNPMGAAVWIVKRVNLIRKRR